MEPFKDSKNTLLNTFIRIARSDDIDLHVVECGEEHWTYGDLDIVSTGLALEFHQKYGPKPIVAIVSENHPYVLATILATWKLGGVVAPFDYNVPIDIMERMLLNIGPTFVLVPSTQLNAQNVIKDLSFPCFLFDPKDATITALIQKFLDLSPQLPEDEFPVPTPDDISLYLHTSSASSVNNVKCVPLTHQSILTGAEGRVAWWKRTWPTQDFEHLRVLGWSPWSHIIGLSHDLAAAMLLTRGTYVFAIIPSAYGDSSKTSRYLDVCGQLLETAMERKSTAFAGVPWVLEGFMRTLKQEADANKKQRILEAIQAFKIFGSGGAATNPECIEFANHLGIPLVLDIGMTEVGGPLFHSTNNGSQGWYTKDCLLPDAHLSILHDDGSLSSTDGELVIKSRFITKGYLSYDNSAFGVEDDGSVVFRTGDIYGYVADQRLSWKGRKEDYIQMSSGESLDPRAIEAILDQCSVIARSCVVGNNFLKTSSQTICAIIEPIRNGSFAEPHLSEITRAVAAANRGVAPPLRISWARVLVLGENQHVPVTKKGAIFRKKLEELFGKQLSALLSRSDEGLAPQIDTKIATPSSQAKGRTKDEITSIVASIVAEALRMSREELENNAQATFAELGMDSAMSTKIVNQLNRQLKMHLPLNTCHTYVDLVALTDAVLSDLGVQDPTASKVLPSARVAPLANAKEEIVIVGQSIRLPGDIDSPSSFWQALMDQRDDIMTTVPPSRWDHASFYRSPDSKEPPLPCDITSEKAGWVDIASFDHSFFGISSSEAFIVTPNVRLTLEAAFEALENANIPLSKIKGTDMGVFVANNFDEGYMTLLVADKGWDAYTRFYGTGVATSTACGRLSYLLDVHGPSISVDTACSSGLIALDQAVQYLQSGAGESAIVCGANTHSWPGVFGFLSAQKMTSVNGRCATFTNEADGYVPSEGAAGFVLKTKSAALRDRDRIIGVIKSTDAKHGGRSQGLVAPNVKAQIAMQIALLEKAGFSPSQIDFVEAHGTGTSLGDLIEIQGINEVFKSSHSPEAPLIVGASKSCIGHAELIAGLIGLSKTLGTFTEGAVPGLVQLTADNMNPSLDCSAVPLLIPHENIILKKDLNKPLRGIILSNGFAGSIAGAILEAPTEDLKPKSAFHIPETTPMMFVVSGKSPEALSEYLNKYLDFCLDASPSLFHAICFTSCVGREHYRYRFACVVHNIQDLIGRIEDRLQNPPNAAASTARRILFAFPGQGSQYQGMGRYLANQYSGFRTIISESANKASASTGYPILPYLIEESAPGPLTIDHGDVAQVCIFTFQYAMARWLQTLGIEAHAVMGHSLGEIAGCVIAGAFSFETGLQFVVARAKFLRSEPGQRGGMLAIAASEDRVTRYISDLGFQDHLSIAVCNAPDNNVVSGELKYLENLMSVVKRDGLRATKLVVEQGFHSPAIASGLPALKQWLDDHGSSMKKLEKPCFSTVRGKEIPKHQALDTQYWVDHAQNTVRFLQTARVAHKASSIAVIVDVGPQPTIWSNMQTPEFAGKSRLAFTGKRGKDQIVAMLSALSALYEKGFSVDFDSLHNQMPYKFSMTDIPTYPFQRIHNYPSYVANRNNLLGFGAPSVDKKPSVPRFVVDQHLCDFLDLHRIEGRRVLPGAAMVDFFARAVASKSVASIRFLVPLVLDTPETQVIAGLDEDGKYHLSLKKEPNTTICSGLIGDKSSSPSIKIEESNGPPTQVMSNAEVYECFKNVRFGDLFRSIHNIKFWETHADGDIKVTPTADPAHDRIRKLDACLHMFGALATRLGPPMDNASGAYLPTSLTGFALHTDDIPYDFTCRYHLPLDVGRGARSLSIAFSVFSMSGDLLVSCEKYTVAWVPRGVVYKEEKVEEVEMNHWLRNGWTAHPLPVQDSATHTFDELLYVGNGPSSRVLRALSPSAKEIISVELSGLSPDSAQSEVSHNVPSGEMNSVPAIVRGQDLLVVVDLTKADHLPDSNDFNSLHIQVLSFLKLIVASKLHISSFLIITSWSAPVDLYKENLDLFSDSKASVMSLVGSIVQGMARVFRRESGLGFAVWCLDLPKLDTLEQSQLDEIVAGEVQARRKSAFFDTFVSYREDASKQSLLRLVPCLEKIDLLPSRSPSGTVVIVGMGSIGIALASALIEAGAGHVVFFGRRPNNNEAIRKELSELSENVRVHCSYRQVDVCDKHSTKTALADVNNSHGGVRHIIHAAAVVKDSTIKFTEVAAYEQVLRPKVLGSWNLHMASQELNLVLDSFVTCSSTNVIVGNPGQIAYVSANSFMDSLATYRHNCGLPGTSLQLGAWESNLIGTIDMSNSFAKLMHHAEGIPLILKAMSVPIPSQIIAQMDADKIAATSSLAKDPFFAPLLTSKKTSTVGKLALDEVKKLVINILRDALELQANEKLDINEPLTACGADSITFAQFKGQVLKDLKVDVPVMYLSDDYTISDMMGNIIETYGAA